MNALFTVLSIASLIGALATGALVLVARRSTGAARILRRRVAPIALPLATAVATVSTAGSLYYSEVAGFIPCTLCWVQRGFMYPLAVVLAAAGFLARRVLLRAALVLAATGSAVSTYHWSIELEPSLQFTSVCSASVPCTAAWVWELGFVSIAFMALTGFLFVIALVAAVLRTTDNARPSRRRRAAAHRDVRPAVTVAAAAVAVALAGAVLPNPGAPAAAEPDGAAVVTAPVDISGETLPPFTDAGTDAAVGQPAPALEGQNFAGEPLTIAADGRPKAILFLAHWCPHCQKEVPAVQQWLDDNGMPEGIDLYSVSTGVDANAPNYPPDAWLEREGWTLPVLADDQESSAAKAFGLPGYPYWVFVDGEGNVAARHSGALPVEQLTQLLDQVQSGS